MLFLHCIFYSYCFHTSHSKPPSNFGLYLYACKQSFLILIILLNILGIIILLSLYLFIDPIISKKNANITFLYIASTIIILLSLTSILFYVTMASNQNTNSNSNNNQYYNCQVSNIDDIDLMLTRQLNYIATFKIQGSILYGFKFYTNHNTTTKITNVNYNSSTTHNNTDTNSYANSKRGHGSLSLNQDNSTNSDARNFIFVQYNEIVAVCFVGALVSAVVLCHTVKEQEFDLNFVVCTCVYMRAF